MRDRAVRLLLVLAVVCAVLAVIDFFIWMSIDAVDCHPSCSVGQDLSGIALVSLPVLAVVLLVAALVRWAMVGRRAGA